MFKFISVALVTLMVSTAAVPAFAKADKGQHGGGKGGGAITSAVSAARASARVWASPRPPRCLGWLSKS